MFSGSEIFGLAAAGHPNMAIIWSRCIESTEIWAIRHALVSSTFFSGLHIFVLQTTSHICTPSHSGAWPEGQAL